MVKIDDLGGGVATGDLGSGVHVDDLGGVNLGYLGEIPTIPVVYSGNLRNVTTRLVYNEAVSVTGTSDELVETYLDTLTPNTELSRYDFSAMSVATYDTRVGDDEDHTNDWTQSLPVTLISDTFAIGGDHNFPAVATSGKCWWITPAGTVVSADVESETVLTNSNARLIKFSTNPSAALARFPICTHASLIAYTGHDVWCFFQELSIKMRYVHSFAENQNGADGPFDCVFIYESVWTGDDIDQGSGRPLIVPCRDGSLVMVGTLATRSSATVNGANDISLDLDQITIALAAEGETFETVELRYGSATDGVFRRVRTGIRGLVNSGTRSND